MYGIVAAAVTVAWKWYAVLIALGVLGLVEVGLYVSVGSWNPWVLVLDDSVAGQKRASTSKLQWLVWFAAVLFVYVVLWVLRARQGDYNGLGALPGNVLAVLGISTATTVTAKGIAVGTETRRANAAALAAAAAAAGAAPPRLPPPKLPPPPGTTAGILVDDSTNSPDLAKVQLIGFTVIAVGIFLATFVHDIVAAKPVLTVPDIDSTLLVLMGISHAGYVGKKVASATG